MQLDLFADPPPVPPPSAIVALARARQHLPCAFGQSGFGWLGPHHCWQCAVETERGCAEFAAAVTRALEWADDDPGTVPQLHES